MSKKTWLVFGIICVAIITGLILVSNGSKVDVSHVDINAIQPANASDGQIADHTYGNMQSKVILIEYGDYQCPGCGAAFPIVRQVVEKYQKQIGYIFRNFPLYSLHPNAFAAAAAAEAAGQQGKFWEMHDKLYQEQNSWNQLSGETRTSFFASAADAIGVDSTKLRATLDSTDIKKKIDYDVALGKKANVSGTPSFFIDGKNVGDQYYVGDKIVDKNTSGAAMVWSNADAFEKLVIIPALQANNIPLPTN